MYCFYNSSPEPTPEQDSQYFQLLPHSSINHRARGRQVLPDTVWLRSPDLTGSAEGAITQSSACLTGIE